MNLLLNLIAVLLTGCAFLAVYHTVIRPALIFWLRRRAIAVRDDLQLAVLAGDIGQHELSVGPTIRKLDILIRGCEHIGIAAVAITLRLNGSIDLEAERDAQIGNGAGSEMKDFIRRADTLVVTSIVANSPFFWVFLPPLFAIGALTGKITRWINSVSLAVNKDVSDDGHGHHGGLAPA